MKQKIVIKIPLEDDKCRSKAMQIASKAQGVSSVAIEGADKDRVVVIGEGVDSVNLARSLRKKFGCATLLTIEEVKPKKDDKKDPPKCPPNCCRPCCLPPPPICYPPSCGGQYPPYYVCEPVCNSSPHGCSIM